METYSLRVPSDSDHHKPGQKQHKSVFPSDNPLPEESLPLPQVQEDTVPPSASVVPAARDEIHSAFPGTTGMRHNPGQILALTKQTSRKSKLF